MESFFERGDWLHSPYFGGSGAEDHELLRIL